MTDDKKDLGEELADAKESARNALSFLSFNITANAPKWITEPIGAVLLDDRTPAFMLGMGIEAAGIAIQMALGIPIYPIVDALVAMTIIGILVWYQRRKKGVKQTTQQG